MKTVAPTALRLVRALAAMSIAGLLWLALNTSARAQLSPSEERLRVLTNPEDIKKKLGTDKEKTLPPIQMFLSQVAPNDVLPFIKANHWSTVGLEVRANYEDFSGVLQSQPVPLLGLAQEMVYRRDARLSKTQKMRLSLQVLIPRIPKELSLELLRPDAIRPDDIWAASLRTLEPHQTFVVVLAPDAGGPYVTWNRLSCLYPQSTERDDLPAADKQRFYRLVFPQEVARPALSPHPLTWTSISHIIWDGMVPDSLNPSQQQALLDWLHWGGQLTLVGGAGPAFSILNDSFLSPYLPADLTGEHALLKREDLTPLSQAYPPVNRPTQAEIENVNSAFNTNPASRYRGYRPPAMINPAPNRPVYLTGLKPRVGATSLSLDESSERLVGVEWRVGRGRVLMLALNPTDPALATWPGLDTFVRRVVLRRPEEIQRSVPRLVGRRLVQGRFENLGGPELSWVRYLTRDTYVPSEEPSGSESRADSKASVDVPEKKAVPKDENLADEDNVSQRDVAAWIDTEGLPRFTRELLEEASGIKIPSALFIMKVVIAYILALVPLNWLICRYVLGRREWAWVVVPVLSLGFAIGVERAAAYDMGYNSACDEIDVVETFGDYPRAHVTRFSSLYSTGRVRFTIGFPNDPTALALPLDNGRTLRGEDISTTVWRSYPVPALEGFLVQPRSLAMVRAEQMTALDGSISLNSEGGTRSIVNRSSLELRDAVVVDVSAPTHRNETPVGTIPPGETVEVKASTRANTESTEADALRPQRYLKVLREAYEDRPENKGEIRLVAWVPRPLSGQKVEPEVDRHRGFTAVVVHLRHGPPPAPDGPVYDKSNSARPGAPETYEVVPLPGSSRGPRASGKAVPLPVKPRQSRTPSAKRKLSR